MHDDYLAFGRAKFYKDHHDTLQVVPGWSMDRWIVERTATWTKTPTTRIDHDVPA